MGQCRRETEEKTKKNAARARTEEERGGGRERAETEPSMAGKTKKNRGPRRPVEQTPTYSTRGCWAAVGLERGGREGCEQRGNKRGGVDGGRAGGWLAGGREQRGTPPVSPLSPLFSCAPLPPRRNPHLCGLGCVGGGYHACVRVSHLCARGLQCPSAGRGREKDAWGRFRAAGAGEGAAEGRESTKKTGLCCRKGGRRAVPSPPPHHHRLLATRDTTRSGG